MLRLALPTHRHTSYGSPLTTCTSVRTLDSFSFINATAFSQVFSASTTPLSKSNIFNQFFLKLTSALLYGQDHVSHVVHHQEPLRALGGIRLEYLDDSLDHVRDVIAAPLLVPLVPLEAVVEGIDEGEAGEQAEQRVQHGVELVDQRAAPREGRVEDRETFRRPYGQLLEQNKWVNTSKKGGTILPPNQKCRRGSRSFCLCELLRRPNRGYWKPGQLGCATVRALSRDRLRLFAGDGRRFRRP